MSAANLGSFDGNCSAETLSISEAIGWALAHNRNLVPAYTDLEKAGGRIVQAGLKSNPEIELSTITDASFNDEGTVRYDTAEHRATKQGSGK